MHFSLPDWVLDWASTACVWFTLLLLAALLAFCVGASASIEWMAVQP
jgi:hypothetical protein